MLDEERKEEEDDLTRKAKGRFWPRRGIRRPLINWPWLDDDIHLLL